MCHLWICLENVSRRPHREAKLTCPDMSQFRMTRMYMCDPKQQGAIHSDAPHAHDAAATHSPSMSVPCSVLELFFEKNSGEVPARSWRRKAGKYLRLEMLATTGGHGSARHSVVHLKKNSLSISTKIRLSIETNNRKTLVEMPADLRLEMLATTGGHGSARH